MTKLLSIDTSTRNFSLAVSIGEEVIRYRNIKLTKVLSSAIVPCIKEILSKSKVSLRGLDGFAIGAGPGSFTSLRVGFSTIKALAFATGKHVVSVPSLDIIAMNVQKQEARVCTICDAKRKMVYACVYEKNGMILKKKVQYLLTGIDFLLDKFSGEIIFTGDGINIFRQEIEEAGRLKKGKFVPKFEEEKFWYPCAPCIVPLALRRFRKKEFDNVNKIVPLYLYPEDCQVRKAGKK